jgi:hypothetical protein
MNKHMIGFWPAIFLLSAATTASAVDTLALQVPLALPGQVGVTSSAEVALIVRGTTDSLIPGTFKVGGGFTLFCPFFQTELLSLVEQKEEQAFHNPLNLSPTGVIVFVPPEFRFDTPARYMLPNFQNIPARDCSTCVVRFTGVMATPTISGSVSLQGVGAQISYPGGITPATTTRTFEVCRDGKFCAPDTR